MQIGRFIEIRETDRRIIPIKLPERHPEEEPTAVPNWPVPVKVPEPVKQG